MPRSRFQVAAAAASEDARIVSLNFTGLHSWPFGSRRLCVACAGS
jgi:hypothetical protein